MSVCVLQNLEKDRVLWTDFLASCREINRFSVSKIGPEPAKPTISLALIPSDRFFYPHHTPMIDTFSCIPFDLPHLIFEVEL